MAFAHVYNTLDSLLFSDTEKTDSIHLESIDRQKTRTKPWEIWLSV